MARNQTLFEILVVILKTYIGMSFLFHETFLLLVQKNLAKNWSSVLEKKINKFLSAKAEESLVMTKQ